MPCLPHKGTKKKVVTMKYMKLPQTTKLQPLILALVVTSTAFPWIQSSEEGI